VRRVPRWLIDAGEVDALGVVDETANAATDSAEHLLVALAMVALQAMASMVTRAPFSAPQLAGRSSRIGITLISLDLSANACCPGTSLAVVAKAETRCFRPVHRTSTIRLPEQ
jgi:hypothetical protein